jgi:hypothetical protein
MFLLQVYNGPPEILDAPDNDLCQLSGCPEGGGRLQEGVESDLCFNVGNEAWHYGCDFCLFNGFGRALFNHSWRFWQGEHGWMPTDVVRILSRSPAPLTGMIVPYVEAVPGTRFFKVTNRSKQASL